MTCKVIQTEKFTAIVCSRGNGKSCACGRRSSLLCDFELYGAMKGKTCDKPLCTGCTTKKEGKDYCKAHAK